MSEFSLIDQYCRNLGFKHDETRIGVGDDGAVLDIPNGTQLVVSVDTMVEGVHFLANVAPAKLAHKLIAVNVSDIGAMGGKAKWATLALTLPEQNHSWLKDFSSGLDAAAKYFGVELVGGDTTRGPLTLSLQVMGLVEAGKALLRSGARSGDAVLVTGSLGDAALALSLLKQNIIPAEKLLNALEQPQPPIEFAYRCAHLASAAIDVSDGLLADLAHVAMASQVSMAIGMKFIPFSEEFLAAAGKPDLALSGGDDYQLAFTVSPENLDEVFVVAKQLNIRLSQIGKVTNKHSELVSLFGNDGKIIDQDAEGYDHF